METSEADDRNEEEASHTHDSHADRLRSMAVGKDRVDSITVAQSRYLCPNTLLCPLKNNNSPTESPRQLINPSEPQFSLRHRSLAYTAFGMGHTGIKDT